MKQKLKYMKLLIIGILSSFLINSCDKGEIDKLFTKTYTYTNNSDHSLSIEKWEAGNSNMFNLLQSETISFRIELGVGGGCFINNETSNICPLTLADSLKIIFDDNKTLIFKPEGERNINILNEDNYEYSQNGNNELFKYGFSEKDYLEAN